MRNIRKCSCLSVTCLPRFRTVAPLVRWWSELGQRAGVTLLWSVAHLVIILMFSVNNITQTRSLGISKRNVYVVNLLLCWDFKISKTVLRVDVILARQETRLSTTTQRRREKRYLRSSRRTSPRSNTLTVMK